MTYYPGPNGIELIKAFEGAPRLVAELCEGGAVEAGYGSTYHLDGRKFKEGERITPEYADQLLAHAMATEARPVWKALRIVPNQNQVDALTAFAYNVGGSAAAGSSVVRFLNEGRFEDAADSFALWTGATSPRPSPREIAKGWVPKVFEYEGRQVVLASEVAGVWRWIGLNGQPCVYFRRLRGLLRRHLAEACVFLGYDWKEACKDDAVFLTSRRDWNASIDRWQDVIINQTRLRDVLTVARRYPLQAAVAVPEPEPEIVAPPPPVIIAEPLPDVSPTPAPEPVLETTTAQIEETPMSTEVKPATKHPLQSSTIWGIVILAMVPQLEGLAQAFGQIGEQVSGPLAGVFQIVGLWLGIAGRFGASLALAIPGKK